MNLQPYTKIRMTVLPVCILCMLAFSGCAKETQTAQIEGVSETVHKILTDARTARKKGDMVSALKILNAAIDADTESAQIYNERGIILLQKKLYDIALSDFSNAIRMSAGNKKYLYNYALTQIKMKKYDEALITYSNIILENDKDARAYVGKGIVYYNSEDYETAIACFNQALKIDSNNLIAVYNRGLARQKAGDIDGAIADFNLCISKKFNVAESLCFRGVCYYQIKNIKRALSDITRAIELDSENYLYFYNKGVVETANFDYNKALMSFTRSLVFKGDFVEAYINRGDIYMRLGKFDKGSRDLQVACNLGACVKRDQYESLGKLVD